MKNLLSLVLVMALLDCQKTPDGSVVMDLRNNPKQEGKAVVSLKGDSISAEQVSAQMMQLPTYSRNRFQDYNQRKEHIESLARFETLAKEASKQGLASHPDVVLATKKAMVDVLLKKQLDETPTPVSDAEAQAYYDKRKNDYVKPEMIRLSHIFWAAPKDAKDRATKIEKAKGVLAQAKALPPLDFVSFAKLVREHTEDSKTKAIDGDLRFLSFDELSTQFGKPFSEAADLLRQPGQVGEALVLTDAGIHVLKLQGRQAALNLTLDQVKPQIQNTLIQQKRMARYSELVKKLETDYAVKVDEEAIKTMSIDFVAPQSATRSPPPGYAPAPTAAN